MTLPFASNRYHVTIWLLGSLAIIGLVAVVVTHWL